MAGNSPAIESRRGICLESAWCSKRARHIPLRDGPPKRKAQLECPSQQLRPVPLTLNRRIFILYHGELDGLRCRECSVRLENHALPEHSRQQMPGIFTLETSPMLRFTSKESGGGYALRAHGVLSDKAYPPPGRLAKAQSSARATGADSPVIVVDSRPSLPDVLRSLRRPCLPEHIRQQAPGILRGKDRMAGTRQKESRRGICLRAHGVLSEQGISPSGTARQSAKLS